MENAGKNVSELGRFEQCGQSYLSGVWTIHPPGPTWDEDQDVSLHSRRMSFTLVGVLESQILRVAKLMPVLTQGYVATASL